MRYQLCEASGKEQLEVVVNQLLEEGWLPSGGVDVTHSPSTGTWWFYQAMVSPEADTNSEETSE